MSSFYFPGDTREQRLTSLRRDLEDTRRRATHPVRSLNIVIDGRGVPLTTGVKRSARIDYDFIIRSWALTADVAGSIAIDIWRSDFAGYPPILADSITGATSPALGGLIKAEDDTLIGWDTELDSGDYLRFNVDSVDGIITSALLVLKLEAQ